MTPKQFNWYRAFTAVILGLAISISFVLQNYLFALCLLAAGMIFLHLLKQRVIGVIADERDYSLAGRSARYTIFIFSLALVITMFILLILGENNESFKPTAFLLSYLVCFQMLLYTFIYRFLEYRAKSRHDK